MSTLDRSLGCPAQPTYSSMGNHGVPRPTQGRNLNGRAECLPPTLQQPYHVSASTTRSSYPSIQSNLMYNGQSSLPLNSVPAQGYDALSFHQEAGIPHLVNHGHQSLAMMQYHTSRLSPSTSLPAILDPLVHAVQSSHLQQIGYSCPNTGQSTIPSSSTSPSIGHLPLQLPSVSYHLTKSGPTSALTNANTNSLTHLPLSSPSSPQMQPIPYESPTSNVKDSSPSPSPLAHSGQMPSQSHSPGLGTLPHTVTLGHHAVQNSSPFHHDDASLSVKPEPEDGDLNFQSIGLQDITLDDGKKFCVIYLFIYFLLFQKMFQMLFLPVFLIMIKM